MPKKMTKNEACATVAKDLREFGYPDTSTQMIREVLDQWLTGKRDSALPHGIIGMFAGKQFDDIEEAAPGHLAGLAD